MSEELKFPKYLGIPLLDKYLVEINEWHSEVLKKLDGLDKKAERIERTCGYKVMPMKAKTIRECTAEMRSWLEVEKN